MTFNLQFVKDKLKSPEFSLFIILLFHVNGLIGLQSANRDWFLALTPLNLLVSLVMVFRHENLRNLSLIMVALLIFLLGYFLEVAGINSGIIFGEYQYGPVLGFQIFGTPLMIGVNWLLMIFNIGVTVEKTRYSVLVKSLIGAAIMTLVDFIIEPVAIAYDFWSWSSGTVVPIQNYVAWFIFSFLFFLIFYKSDIERNNKVAPWLLLTHVIFFLTLNLLI